MMIGIEADQASRSLSDLYYSDRDEYRRQQADIKAQFTEAMHCQTEDLPEAVRTLMFQKAWDDGHAGGYHEVQNHFEELEDFVRKVVDEVSK